jgi:hypothetical protein
VIAACASRFDRDCPPLVWPAPAAHVGLVLLDGVESWGSGAEAAAWTREYLARRFEQGPPTSPEELSEALRRAIGAMPASISGDPWGWSFSAAAVLVRGAQLHAASMGRHAIIVVGSRGTTILATPPRVIDDLVAAGHVAAADAERHELSGVLKGPLLGETWIDLAWSPAIDVADGDLVIVGDAALPRLLRFHRLDVSTDAVRVRDAVEQYAGRSASTAIIACGPLAAR